MLEGIQCYDPWWNAISRYDPLLSNLIILLYINNTDCKYFTLSNKKNKNNR
jgi:hypothetical protein